MKTKIATFAIAVVFILLIVFAFRFPGKWVRVIWPLPKQGAAESQWDYWQRVRNNDRLPCFFGRSAKRARVSSDAWKTSWVHLLYDFEIQIWDSTPKPRTKNVAFPIPPVPPYAFGEARAIPADHPIWEIQAKTCETPGKCESYIPKTEFNCRHTAFVNPAPVPAYDPHGSYTAALTRMVCPFNDIPDKWTLSENVMSIDPATFEVIGGSGFYRKECITADPLMILNLPPTWVDSCKFEDCFSKLRSSVETEGLPQWPIFVEDKGMIRQATKADAEKIKNGNFHVSN